MKDVPFSRVIILMPGFSIISFGKDDENDIILLQILDTAMEKTIRACNKNGFLRTGLMRLKIPLNPL